MKRNAPHILIIPSWYPFNKDDISGSFFREQALSLHKEGCYIGVIHPQFRSLKDWKGIFSKPYGLRYELDNGVKTIRWDSVFFIPKLHILNRLIWVKKGIKLFETYIKKYGKPDVIHAHSLINAGYLALYIHKKYKIPFVVTEHSTGYASDLIKQRQIDELKHIVKASKGCFAVSNEFATLLNGIFDSTSWESIPNMVHNDFLTTPLKNNPTQFSFINICLLNEKKRIDILLRAFARFIKIVPNVILKIGGDGPEKENLMQLAMELNISNNVLFLGKLTREQVKEAIINSSAFVLSSEYETFGVVLIEALALGKPAVATRCGGPESIINSDVGYLVKKNSEQELTQGMLDIYKNKDQFSGQDIRNYCVSKFSGKVIANKLIDRYKNIINTEYHQ